jgi:hypothetical protein
VASTARFTTFFASFASLVRAEFVRSALFMSCMPAFPAGHTRLFRIELVSSAFFVGSLSAFPAGCTRLFRSKLMGGAFLVGCLSTLTGYFTLPAYVHRGKTPPALASASVTAVSIFI